MGEQGHQVVALRPLPLTQRRAVGGPVARALVASYFAVAATCWLAASCVGVVAAGDLAAGRVLAPAPVLAVHLLALGVLPFAVAGACFHLLPVMLRNDLLSQPALWIALPLLAGGVLVASGLGRHVEPLVWGGVALLVLGLGIVLTELLALVVRAPSGRTLIASRAGVTLSCLHAVAALSLGAIIFEHDAPFAGISYERWLLIHLHVALLGWIGVLVITVGRNLGPMLAQAPAARERVLPLEELMLTAGLWVLVGGIAADARAVTIAGGLVVIAAIARFASVMIGAVRARRAPLEAPLARLLTGAFFLAQAAALGLAAAVGAGGTRLVSAYVVLLLVGWAGGVVLGHVGKLLSLSLWVWWPPGPRPKQAALYPRRLGLAETMVFATGVEAFAVGIAVGSAPTARAGAAILVGAAILNACALLVSWRRGAQPGLLSPEPAPGDVLP